MFKSNPHFNEYYGLIRQNKKKLKRTQCSGHKLQSSKKSFSQDSLNSGNQTSLHKRKTILGHDFNQRKNHNTKNYDKINHDNKDRNILKKTHEEKIQLSGGILQQFIIGKCLNEEDNQLKESIDLVKNYRKHTAMVQMEKFEISNKFIAKKSYKNELGEYFGGQSIDLRNLKSEKNTSRSNSHRERSQKSPLRRILKSKSRQEVFTPVEKMYNILKQEQKQKEMLQQTQKTLKHINQVQTFNELNETRMNYPSSSGHLYQVRSQKNLHEIEPMRKTKKHGGQSIKLRHLHQQKKMTYPNHQNKINSIKRAKSETELLMSMGAGKQKISSSKIKKYFNKKEESERNKMKVKWMLEDLGASNHIEDRLKKIQSERVIGFHDGSQVSESIMSNSCYRQQSSSQYRQQGQSEQKGSYNRYNESSQNYNQESTSKLQYSEYGLEIPETPIKPNRKNFYTTPRQNHIDEQYQREGVPQSPAGEFIEKVRGFEQSKFKEFLSESDLNSSQVMRSVASIQDSMGNRTKQRQMKNARQHKQKNNRRQQAQSSIQEKNRSYTKNQTSECNINVISPPQQSNYETPSKNHINTYQQGQQSSYVSVNTPAYRHNAYNYNSAGMDRHEKKPKQSIISKLKKDIEQDKQRNGKSRLSKSRDSKMSRSRQSKLSKRGKNLNTSQMSSENPVQTIRQSDYTQSDQFTSTNRFNTKKNMNPPSSTSNVDSLSNLINTQQLYYNQDIRKKQLLYSSPLKLIKTQTSPQKIGNNQARQNLHQEELHELSEFQSMAESRYNKSSMTESKKTVVMSEMIESHKRSGKKMDESLKREKGKGQAQEQSELSCQISSKSSKKSNARSRQSDGTEYLDKQLPPISRQKQSFLKADSRQKGSQISKRESQISSKRQQSSQWSSPNSSPSKKPIKFLKIVKPLNPQPPRMQQSNLESLSQSIQTYSMDSSNHASNNLIRSSGLISQSMKLSLTGDLKREQDKKMNQCSKTINEESSVQPSNVQNPVNKSNNSEQSQKSEQYESVDMSEAESKECSQSQYSKKESIGSNHPKNLQKSNSKQASKHQRPSNQSSSSYSESESSRTITNNNSSRTTEQLNIDSKSSFSSHNTSNRPSQLTNSVSRPQQKINFPMASNGSPSKLFSKKKNFAEYTLNDVARYIEEHEWRIEAYCIYVDNAKQVYEEDYEMQKIQLLNFLMLKKNLYELNRAILALQNNGQNVFYLTDIQIIDDVLEDYLEREQIQQQLQNMIKQQKLTEKQLKEMYVNTEKKYQGQKGFSLSLDKDDFSSEIVKKLGHELFNLYEKWQRNKSHGDKVTAAKLCQKYEKRMVQIIELIFLTSELDGKKVKSCELLAQNQPQFRSYYQKWFERIIQTIEYFDSKSKNQAM